MLESFGKSLNFIS